MSDRRSGGCLCGSVRYTVTLVQPRYNICHCGMCRKWSAGPFMAVHCAGDDVVFDKDETLQWYQGSPWAERGFCAQCGTGMFYRLVNNPQVFLGVSVDSLDDASDIVLERHMFSDAQPDRYAFADTTPRATEAEMLKEFEAAFPPG